MASPPILMAGADAVELLLPTPKTSEPPTFTWNGNEPAALAVDVISISPAMKVTPPAFHVWERVKGWEVVRVPDAKVPLVALRTPAAVNLATLVPATCASHKLPANPLAALSPSPVPDVLHPVDVVPVGSMRSWGLVVVAEPPVNLVPVRLPGGTEAAPAP